MLLRIISPAANKASRRQIFLVSFPGPARRLDLVRKAGGIDEAIRAITGDVKGVPANQGEVIGQAWVGYGKLTGEQRILAGPLVINLSLIHISEPTRLGM